MSARHVLDPATLLGCVLAFRDRLREREDEINGLNVFPVPDGDTGTNVLLTVQAALAAVVPAPVSTADPAAAVGDDPRDLPDLASLCDQLTRGIILGARGSSGVILSQAFVAALATLASSTEPASKTLAAALERARVAAYGAVAQPVEGTILTVLSSAAATAAEAIDLSLPDLTELVAVEARSAVARTPTLLPVLARAGVVDSGGRALSLGFDALAEVVGGRALPLPPPVGHAVLTPLDADDAILSGGAALEGGGRYEVVASVHTDEQGAARLRDRWREVGDAVVVSGAGHTWRAHVHTDDPDAALAAGRDAAGGQSVNDVSITDLRAQVAARVNEPRSDLVHADGLPAGAPEEIGVGLVAVAEGPGLVRAFGELGAEVVDPGNAAPSVQDLLDAIERCPGSDVILLPNDSNVHPAAAQARELATKRVHVVPTRSQLAGLAAAVVFDPAAGTAANASAMAVAVERTHAGRVAPVVRESVVAIGPVHPGQWLALADRVAVAVGQSAVETALALAGRLCSPRTELLTIVWGTAATPGQARELQERLMDQYPEVAVDLLDGGHHDAFLLSAEDDPEGVTDQS